MRISLKHHFCFSLLTMTLILIYMHMKTQHIHMEAMNIAIDISILHGAANALYLGYLHIVQKNKIQESTTLYQFVFQFLNLWVRLSLFAFALLAIEALALLVGYRSIENRKLIRKPKWKIHIDLPKRSLVKRPKEPSADQNDSQQKTNDHDTEHSQ